MGVTDFLTSLVGTDTTYTYRCNNCGTEFESSAQRHEAECPDCGGPPEPNWQE